MKTYRPAIFVVTPWMRKCMHPAGLAIAIILFVAIHGLFYLALGAALGLLVWAVLGIWGWYTTEITADPAGLKITRKFLFFFYKEKLIKRKNMVDVSISRNFLEIILGISTITVNTSNMKRDCVLQRMSSEDAAEITKIINF